MANLDIREAALSDMTNRVADISVSSKSIDGISNQDETTWINAKWTQYWGYFNEIADLKSAILMKAIWNVGKGYEADPETEVILDHISGWGKDTFDDILFNMEVIRRIGGDSFAEIIRADDKTLINIKPLDPGSMRIVLDKLGIIKRYEQISRINGDIKKFGVDEIFHLCNNRLASQIHGISDIESMEATILAEKENFEDMKKIMHHQARPLIMWKLGTDVASTISAFAEKMDKAVNKGENIYIPADENAVSYEVVQVNVSSIILDWRNDIKNKFYRAMGLPQVVFGSSGATESGSKIEYLAHEQIFEKDQRYLEKQIWNQLGLKIDLIPPVSLLENLQTDEKKDMSAMGTPQGTEFQPQDITPGAGE